MLITLIRYMLGLIIQISLAIFLTYFLYKILSKISIEWHSSKRKYFRYAKRR